ncbi:MAG: hypothetical protein CSA35_02225 [Dethiosulfovibrio peptidovorans]|nr:MAG: hypothetical protein CSA35_02225 [Dethiosulfovibrio peptidovorans]
MKKTTVGIGLFVFVAVLVGVLAVTDLGTGLVRSQAIKALSKAMDARVSLGDVSGNPIKGYNVKDLQLIKDGAYSLAVPLIQVKPNLLGLLGKGAVVDRITLLGVSTTVDQIQALIDNLPLSEGGERPSLPVKTVEVRRSALKLPEGTLQIAHISAGLSQKDMLEVDLDLDVRYRGLTVIGQLVGAYGNSVAKVDRLDLSVGSGRVTAHGDLLPDLSAEVDLSKLDLAELAALWPQIASVGVSGLASGTVSAGGTLTTPVLSGTTAFDGALAGMSVVGLEGQWQYENMAMDVPSLKAVVTGVPLSGRLNAQFGRDKPRIDLKMNAANADLGKLRTTYPQIPKEISGVVESVALVLEGPVDALKGTVKARAQSLSVWGQPLTKNWLSVSLSPKGVAKISAKTLVRKQPAYLGGSVALTGKTPEADLLLKARQVPIALVSALAQQEIPLKGDLDLDVTVKGSLNDPAVAGTVSAPSLAGFGQKLEKASVRFVLKKSAVEIPSAQAQWFGAPLSVSGHVAFGKEPVTGSFTADMKGLNTAVVASGFGAPSGIVTGAVDISARFQGVMTNPAIVFAASSPKLIFSGIPVTQIDLAVEGTPKNFTVTRGSALLGGGRLSASGTVGLERAPVLDLAVSAAKVQAGTLVPVPVTGLLSGTLTVKGSASAPDLEGAISSPKVVAWGLEVDDISAAMSGEGTTFFLKEAKGSIGGSPLSLKGTVDVAGRPKGSFSLSGDGLDLSKATKGIMNAQEYGVGGVVSLVFSGTFEGGKGTGTGSISSPSLRVMNVLLKDVSYPLELKGSVLKCPAASAQLYGGALKGSGWVDFSANKFSKTVSVSGTDVAPLIRDFAGIKGSISGTAKAQFSGSGTLAPFAFKGVGTADLGGGQMIGFPLADVAASLYGAQGIRYRSAHSAFRVIDSALILDKGTLVTAHDGDPIYHQMTATGSIGPEKKLNLACTGEVNMKLLQALVGAGVGGVLGGGVGTLAAVVGGALGGAQQGFSKDDFRDISLRVVGTTESPSVKDLKIGPSKLPESQEVPEAKPAIPGVISTGTPQQVKEQIKEQAKEKIKDAVQEEAGKILQGILGDQNN